VSAGTPIRAVRPAGAGGELTGRVLTASGLVPGRLRFDDRIVAVDSVEGLGDAAALPVIAPGFVDQHVHGGGGGDTMDGEAGVRSLARHHLAHGTTALLPTTLTAPWPEVLEALAGVAAVMGDGAADEAVVLGAHLEGPFVSPQRLGAQPPYALEPTAERVAAIVATGVVRVVTIAPELPGAFGSVAAWVAAGVRLNVGHTRADAETVEGFLAAVRAAGGRAGATHLFNAMGGLEGRAPGPVGALLGDADAVIELIADGFHVAPAALRTAWRAAGDRFVLVTDAIRASGMRRGTSELGGQRVTVTDGAARLDDGTLAGSMLTMDAAVRGAVRAGLPLGAALAAASTAPARALGLRDRGALAVGARADVVVLTPGLQVAEVYLGGVRLPSLA
jgi:N-acetylglucosamine-6-phosphate deacetylase